MEDEEWVSIKFKIPKSTWDVLVKHKGYETHWWKFMLNEVFPAYLNSKSRKVLSPKEQLLLINEGRGL